MVTKSGKTHRPISKAREAAQPYEAGTESPGGIIREIPAGEFKAKCLAIMDDVQQRGGAYVITKRGIPVAKLVPARVEPRPLLGSMKGTVATRGDLVSPLDEPWDALDGWDDER
jgi:prevent-host-death family protein